jgi:tetratricopeptide (TPR) repeat protein
VAIQLGKQGLLQECARLCRDTLDKYAKLFDDIDSSQISLIRLYGYTLYRMGQFEEATLWLRKLYALNRDRKAGLMFACDFLGRCYQSQGLYEDAMDLYRLTIAELEMRNDRTSNIQLVRQWLNVGQPDIRDCYEASSQESSDSDTAELNVTHRIKAGEESSIYTRR